MDQKSDLNILPSNESEAFTDSVPVKLEEELTLPAGTVFPGGFILPAGAVAITAQDNTNAVVDDSGLSRFPD